MAASTRYRWIATLAALAAVVGIAAVFSFSAAPAWAAASSSAAPEPSRRGELITLVRQDCGSCHGLTLKGGLGPSLLPEALRDKPAFALKATILHGRPGTAMPPWQRFMNEAEAEWIVEQLQQGFPQ